MLPYLLGWVGFVFNVDLLNAWGWRLLLGLRVTAEVVLIACSLGFLLAWPLSLARRSRNPLLAWPVLAYTAYFRGTPLLCQLYLVYYGAGELRPALASAGLWWFFRDAFYCCIFAFTLNTAAYQSEILRGAVLAVPKGQLEAARALGLSRLAIARHVIWPQAMLVALRPLGNELISIVKASALAAIVTLMDLMGETRLIFARTFDFSIYLYAAILYLAITQAISQLWNWLERLLSRHLIIARAVTAPVAQARARGPALDPVSAEF
jgi:polar amino acid transport system permease protein